MGVSDAISPERITRCEELIRPFMRRTPVIDIDGADFGLHSIKLCLKLELFQHSGSFKARGAFANLLMRKVPVAGRRRVPRRGTLPITGSLLAHPRFRYSRN